jgi:hypothetical protein
LVVVLMVALALLAQPSQLQKSAIRRGTNKSNKLNG